MMSGLFIGGLIFFVSCNRLETENNAQIFFYNESNGIASLDPAYAKDLASINACEQVYNGLIQLNSDLTIKPSIAKEWQISDDLKTYIFTLNTNVYYHENKCFGDIGTRRVKADDFVFSFNRIMDSKVSSPGLWIFEKLDKEFGLNGIKAINDSVLMIKLKDAYAPFLSLLTMKYCSVIPSEAIRYYGSEFRKNPVGTGPFYLKYWEEDVKLILLRNDKYFEQNLPYLDAVSVSFLVDKQSEFLLFLQRKLDYVSGISPALKDELLEQNGHLTLKYIDEFQLLKTPYLNTEYIGILMDTNLAIVKNSPLKNLSFRKALNYSIDKLKMVNYINKNVGMPAVKGFLPQVFYPSQITTPTYYTFDEKKAKELFAKAKIEMSLEEFPTISFAATNKSYDICKYLQYEWSKFGVNIEIELNQWASLREMVANSKVNFFRASWIADYPDAENYFLLFGSQYLSPKGPNYTHFQSQEYDRLLKMLSFASGIEEKVKLYQSMDSIIMANASVIPLYYDEVVRFLQTDIQGFEPNSLNLMILKNVKKIK